MSKRNPIEITFYFNTIEEAIATLGSLVQKAAPVANVDKPAQPVVLEVPSTKPRKPRADAGKPRGPYKNVEAPGAGSATPPTAPAAGDAAGGMPAASTPETAAPSDADRVLAGLSSPAAPTGAAATIVPETDAQAALERLFAAKGAQPALQLLAQFGVKRGRDLKPEDRAAFIKKADEVANG